MVTGEFVCGKCGKLNRDVSVKTRDRESIPLFTPCSDNFMISRDPDDEYKYVEEVKIPSVDVREKYWECDFCNKKNVVGKEWI